MNPFSLIRKVNRRIARLFEKKATFAAIRERPNIFLYAGDVPDTAQYRKYFGLSIEQENRNHIAHDITTRHDLRDNSVDIYQVEDVFEHIEYEVLPRVVDDIFRILKPGGIFRMSIPDYGCDILQKRSQRNEKGEIVFDPIGGGRYVNGKVIEGGHLWFPTYSTVSAMLNRTKFKDIRFYHYYDHDGTPVTKPIDYSIGFVQRTPDHDDRVKSPYRPMSIVVDCVKS